ncbi:HAD family acid phosphatase [Kineosporia babensis]
MSSSAGSAPLLRFEPSGYTPAQVRSYYGDSGSGQIAAASPYLADVRSVLDDAQVWLGEYQVPERAAIVLDVDDTALSTYTYGAATDFAGWHDVHPFAKYVMSCQMQAVAGVPEFAHWAAERGFALFYLTSRPDQIHQITLQNLLEQGYAEPAQLFCKPGTQPFPEYLPALVEGTSSHSTVAFKTATRAHLQAQGYDVIANIGDQQSDLEGAYARRTFKLPNRMYLLP